MAGRLSNLKASFHSMATHPSARLAMACTILQALGNSQQVGRLFNKEWLPSEEARQQVEEARILKRLVEVLLVKCLNLEEALGIALAKLLAERRPWDSLLTLQVSLLTARRWAILAEDLGRAMANLPWVSLLMEARCHSVLRFSSRLSMPPWANLLVMARCHLANSTPLVSPHRPQLFNMAMLTISSSAVKLWRMDRLRPCRELNLHAPVASLVLSAQYERKGRTPAESSSAAPVPKASSVSSSSLQTSRHVQMDSPSSLNKASSLKLKAQHALVVCPACNSQRAKKVQTWAESSTSVQSSRENNVATFNGLMSRHAQLAKCKEVVVSSHKLMALRACAASQRHNVQHARKGQTLAGSSSRAPNNRANNAATSSGPMRRLRRRGRLANVGPPVSIGL